MAGDVMIARERRRGSLTPARRNRSPIVLAAGQTRRGSRSHKIARNFFGPHRGCFRRKASTASQIAAAVARPWVMGARDRSANPCAGSPS